jgi:hypothetical protein
MSPLGPVLANTQSYNDSDGAAAIAIVQLRMMGRFLARRFSFTKVKFNGAGRTAPVMEEHNRPRFSMNPTRYSNFMITMKFNGAGHTAPVMEEHNRPRFFNESN